jgi:S-adenosylmethionine decarboxylase
MKEEHFGEHFMLDGYKGDKAKLDDKELVLEYIEDLIIELGMHKLAEPVILFAPENDKKDPGGWSGFVVIAESHISIHTFPKRGFVSIDVYTCKNGLNSALVEKRAIDFFDLKETEVNFVKRGKKYPIENIY